MLGDKKFMCSEFRYMELLLLILLLGVCVRARAREREKETSSAAPVNDKLQKTA